MVDIRDVLWLFKSSDTCQKHRDLLDTYYLAKNERDAEKVKWFLKECLGDELSVVPDRLLDLAINDIKETWEQRIPPATEHDLENVSNMNNIIAGQDDYGVRKWDERNGVVAGWSNGAELWVLDRYKTKELKEHSLNLDANEIILPVTEEEFLRVQRRLAPLPLFFGSMEAKDRKIVDWDTADDVWLYGQLKRILREKKR